VALDLKQLESKPWYFGFGIGAAIGIVLFVLCTYYAPPNFEEMRARIEGKKREIAALDEKIAAGRAAERRLPQLREEVRRIELDLQRLLQILPQQRNTEELIKKIEALVRQGDFFLRRFSPQAFINKDFYAEWPIQIQVDGTYHNLALFFDRMARFPRIINVDNLVMTGYANDPSGRTINATFTAKTFVYLPENDVDQAAAQGAPGQGAAPGGAK
jgi:type IV pilus assembly protein PilO